MCLLSLILLVAGFFFPPAWLGLVGIGIYWYASRKSRRDEAVEKRVRKVVLSRQNNLTFQDLYFEAARAYAIAKGGGTGGEEDSASVTMLVEGSTYFVVFIRVPAQEGGGTTIAVTNNDQLRDALERPGRGDAEPQVDDPEELFGFKPGTLPGSSSGVASKEGSSAPARTPFIGMMDIDDFDSLNARLGRSAGDQVMAAYKRLAATNSGGDILNETGFMMLQDAMATEALELHEVIVCFPYSSGDEFIFQHWDPQKVRAVLDSIQREANDLEIPIHDDAGATVAVLHGIPVSIGSGPTRDEAWKQVIAQKRTGGRRSISGRIEVLSEPRHGDSPTGAGVGAVSVGVLRDGPGVDPQTRLPTTLEVTAEPSPRGPIPVLMWGPVETRRPGWTKTDHEKMSREIAGHMLSLGISDSNRIKETTEEVAQLSEKVWTGIMQALARAQAQKR